MRERNPPQIPTPHNHEYRHLSGLEFYCIFCLRIVNGEEING